MEMKFDLAMANWLAYLIDSTSRLSKLGFSVDERQKLELFLEKAKHNSLSLLNELEKPAINNDDFQKLLSQLQQDKAEPQNVPDHFYDQLRLCLRKKRWIAFILPSGVDTSLDEVLLDPELINYVSNSSSNNYGLILQLDEATQTISALLGVHSIFRTALNEISNWPGVLLWLPEGDAVFLPVNSDNYVELDIETRMQWIFSKLNSESLLDLGVFKREYRQAFPEVFENEAKTINILHLSNLHIGNKRSSLRMPSFRDLLSTTVRELGEISKIIPVVTGDLMDNPSEKHLTQVSDFWNYLTELGVEEPIFALGNRDVRKDGQINENYRNSVGFPITKIIWLDNEKIALICVNSVANSKLEIGSVDQEQLEDIEYELERKKDHSDYKLIILMHHHPIKHDAPDDLKQPFYDRVIGKPYKQIEALDNCQLLEQFINKYSISAVLHGHGHIPLINQAYNNTPVIGCGCSIGLLSETDGGIYFSINILSINQVTQKISSRLIAAKKIEGGMIEVKWHELIYRDSFQ